jgi:hypothetical protein
MHKRVRSAGQGVRSPKVRKPNYVGLTEVNMTDKFEIYDIIGVLVPGVLLVCVLPLFFPSVISLVSVMKFPEAFTVIALTALAVLIGHIIQSLASACEKPMYWTWGGRPSDRAFTVGLGDRYLPLDTATRIRTKLLQACPGASERSLFLYAMQRAETSGGRTARFNALFAYHRAILVLTAVVIALFLASFAGGLGSTLGWDQKTIILLSLALFLVLAWYRAKQRGFYYVREVLLKAEHDLDAKGKRAADDSK